MGWRVGRGQGVKYGYESIKNVEGENVHNCTDIKRPQGGGRSLFERRHSVKALLVVSETTACCINKNTFSVVLVN